MCPCCNENEAKQSLSGLCEGCFNMLCTGGDDAVWVVEKLQASIAGLRGEVAEWQANCVAKDSSLDRCALRIAELESQLKWQEDAHQLALRKAGAEMESLQEKNADLEAIAAEREKIATIAVQRYREIANAA